MADADTLQLIVTIDAGSARDAVIEAARPCVAATRQEDGCIAYNFYADRDDGGRLYVIETWRDDAALDAHMRTPHFEAFASALADHVPGGFEKNVTLRKAHQVAG